MIDIIDLRFLGFDDAIACFLVETAVGPVLVETGPHSTLPNIEKSLAQKGYTLQDVQHVFLTHIHLDHAGAAWYFAQHGATVYLHPFGERHMADPSKLMSSASRIYKDQMDSLWGQMNPIETSQLKTLAHGDKIELGEHTFTAWHTPGHAVHHIAWQLNEDTLFAGDVAGVKILGGMVVPPCPPPDINVEDWQASIALIKSLNIKTMYLTHFGAVTNIEEHLNQLEKNLLSWANWIKPHWEAERSPQDITPEFQAFTQQQLLDCGVAKENLHKYEAANPSWMSVAGLLRYWRKKSEA